jgi:hypothetical protein
MQVQDIRGALTVSIISEFFIILDLLEGFVLSPEVCDEHRWEVLDFCWCCSV